MESQDPDELDIKDYKPKPDDDREPEEPEEPEAEIEPLQSTRYFDAKQENKYKAWTTKLYGGYIESLRLMKQKGIKKIPKGVMRSKDVREIMKIRLVDSD